MIIEKIRRITLLSEMDTAVLNRCIAEKAGCQALRKGCDGAPSA